MSDPWAEPRTQRWIAHVQHQVLPMIHQSNTFISIVPPTPDVKCAVELGYGILRDKPLIVVCPPERTIPLRLRRAADLVIAGTDDQAAIANRIREFIEAHRG